MQVVVDGLLTRYEVHGTGKNLLLVHGWGDSAAGLAGLRTALAKHYRVLAVDLPGFGTTEAPHGVWGLDAYAEFVAHFLAKIDEKPLHAIIGHSNGGAIALRGLARDVLHADKVVLLASAGIRGEYKGRVKVLRILAKAGKALTAPLPAPIKEKLRKKAYHTIGSDMLVAEHMQETFKKIVTDDVRADATQLKLPVLLVYGDNDESTPLRYARVFHERIRNARLEIVPGAGHFVHNDRPDIVGPLLLEFLG